MALKLLCAFLLAFLTSTLFGRRLIPWLKDHGFTQVVKDEVKERVYAKNGNDGPHGSR